MGAQTDGQPQNIMLPPMSLRGAGTNYPQTDLTAVDRGLKRKKTGIFSNGWRIPWFGSTHIMEDGLTVSFCRVDESSVYNMNSTKHLIGLSC